jgi:hypothetical protein
MDEVIWLEGNASFLVLKGALRSMERSGLL